MAPAYKLTYFNFTALAEPIRMLMKYGGIDFEDVRIELERWPEEKDKMPFGQMPILEHNGKVMYQSTAIARYIAKQVKLVGKDDWENLEIDAAVDTVTDIRIKLALYHWEADEKVKASKKEPLFNEYLPYTLERLEKVAEKNKGHLAVGRLTWADIFFTAMLDYFCGIAKEDILAKYPNLQAVKNNVVALPAIKSWIATRPKSIL